MYPECQYTAHITFVRVQGDYVPWHMYFVNTRKPNQKIGIVLDKHTVQFQNNDILFNERMDQFPRKKQSSDRFEDCFLVPLSDIEQHIKDIYQEHLKGDPDGWDVIIGATDTFTYNYLKNILPEVIQLPQNITLSERIALSAALNVKQNNWDWNEE